VSNTDYARSLLAKRYPRPVILQLLRDRGMDAKRARDTLYDAMRRAPRSSRYAKRAGA
jgi:hypothetical protein